MYPASAKIEDLEKRHPEYDRHWEVWNTIQDLREGAATLLERSQKYLPMRPGEDQELYRLRLRKFSYTPLMANSIREFTAKLASSPVNVSGATAPFWADFWDRMDGQSADESEVLNRIFSCLLYFGKVYLGVDQPETRITSRSLAEDPKNTPYLILYEPLSVTNWGAGWYQTRQLVTRSVPLVGVTSLVQWTFWTSEGIYRYECPEDLLKSPKAKAKRTVAHASSALQMVSLELPTEMWVGNSVFLKQLQHCWIESSWTDAGSIAGLVQRVFTPSPPVPMDDPRVLLEDSVDHSKLKADNAHILIGGGFVFAESTGQAIANLTGQLETIERQIRELCSMGFMSATKGQSVASGAAKSLDQALMRDSMKAYGKKVAQMYQDLLGVVAKVARVPDVVTVQGLDTYSVDNLEDMVDTTGKMLKFSESIPVTAQRLWLSKLAGLLTGTVSPDDAAQMKMEIATLALPVAPLNNVVTAVNNNPQ